MNQTKQNVERLATLNAWVTSCVVLLNLLVSFIAFSVPTFRSLSLVIFVSGTVGGAASNYRRLQEAYVQQLRKPVNELEMPTTYLIDDKSDEASTVKAVEVVPKSESSRSEPAELNKSPIEDYPTYFILKLQIFLSPIFGGLFAVVLYAVFISGIIQGELFPKFKGTTEEFTTPYKFADNTLPATNADLSKAILWAFIAGFAEGFVPNFIDKLVKDGEQE
jgi:hypothetical protein